MGETRAMDAVILAGGAGTRLRSLVHDRPKPMAEVAGRPFLAYLLEYLSHQGVERVVLSVGYLQEQIVNYFGSRYGNIAIRYAVEQEPLGTGGAIRLSLSETETDSVLVLNGDTYFPLDLTAMEEKHIQEGCMITMALKEMRGFDRYGSVSVDADRVAGFTAKGYREQGFINGGIYILDRRITSCFPPEKQFSFENDFLEKMVEKVAMCTFISDSYFIDIGVPEDYDKVQADFGRKLTH